MLEALKQWLQCSGIQTEEHETICSCCGECCESFGDHLHASKSDLERWHREGRNDLLSRVNRLGWIWVDPKTQKTLERCPFIVKINDHQSVCDIQDTKPDICRDYPTLAHGRRCLKGVFLK